MNYVYGPVPSRRLGQSLGIDPVPLKTCNWNCVYCQLGRSKPLVNERVEYFPPKDILAEVEKSLASHKPGEIDWVTFVGSGETTLHASIGWLIREVKALTDLPVAVITNGSLLYKPEMRKELSFADAVLPSLDAGDPDLYRRVNRPYPALTFERLLDGLIAFRENYQGNLWVEVMLVRDLNDSEEALRGIASALERIQPDEIHIVQPTRPPVETWVQPPDEEGIMRAIAILGDVAQVVHPQEGSFDLSGSESIVDAIIGIITRHPMSEEQLLRTIAIFPTEQRDQIINTLKVSSQAQIIERFGQNFWCAAPSVFPDTGKLNKPSVHKHH